LAQETSFENINKYDQPQTFEQNNKTLKFTHSITLILAQLLMKNTNKSSEKPQMSNTFSLE